MWAQHEDDAIKQLVASYGTRSWSAISEHILSDYAIPDRTGKQCRERWHNHLGGSLPNFTWEYELGIGTMSFRCHVIYIHSSLYIIDINLTIRTHILVYDY